MSLKEFFVQKQTIQARVINAFKLWVDVSADFKGTFHTYRRCTGCLYGEYNVIEWHINFLLISDNPSLQNEVLHFINTVLIHDHPRLCKPLRTNILVIKVKLHNYGSIILCGIATVSCNSGIVYNVSPHQCIYARVLILLQGVIQKKNLKMFRDPPPPVKVSWLTLPSMSFPQPDVVVNVLLV